MKLKIDLIENERSYYDKYGPNVYPAVVINNQTFRGQLEIEAVFSGICSGFSLFPSFCNRYVATNDYNNDDLVLMTLSSTGIHNYLRVLSIVTAMMLFFCFMLLCYRRSAKRAMKVEVRQ